MRNYIVKEESLIAIADSIRAKTGGTEELVFPDGFAEAVEGIETRESPIYVIEQNSFALKRDDFGHRLASSYSDAMGGYFKKNIYWYTFPELSYDTFPPASSMKYELDIVDQTTGQLRTESFDPRMGDLRTVPTGTSFGSTGASVSYTYIGGKRNNIQLQVFPYQIMFDSSGSLGSPDALVGPGLSICINTLENNPIIELRAIYSGASPLASFVADMRLNAQYLCAGLENLIDFNMTDIPVEKNTRGMFLGCTRLRSVSLFDTSLVQNTREMFYNCTALTTVPQFDMRSAYDVGTMFNYCSSITECWLRNIKTSLTVGSGTSWGHLLTVESLLHLIKECRQTSSIKTLTIGTANMKKLANTYVKVIDITDEMRAEDDLIDEKLPFEVCESTDEGAMLISEYVLLKNWQLK